MALMEPSVNMAMAQKLNSTRISCSVWERPMGSLLFPCDAIGVSTHFGDDGVYCLLLELTVILTFEIVTKD